jgi:hypothetical protein
MEISNPAVIVAISGLISAVFAVVGSYFATKNAAKKDALTLANEAVDRMTARLNIYDSQIKKIRQDYDDLWNTLHCERDEWEKQTKTFGDKILKLQEENGKLKDQLDSYIARCECKDYNDHQYNNNK